MKQKGFYRIISMVALLALLVGQLVSLSSYSATPKLSASLSGTLLTVKASGFPANARLKSVIVWNPGSAFEDFPLNLTYGGIEYGYNDVMYGYEDFGKFITTDGSGSLTFSFRLSSDTTENDKVIQIWTEGFTAGTEADASAAFKYPSGGSTPTTTAPATTAPATTAPATTAPATTAPSTTGTTTGSSTESSEDETEGESTEPSSEAVPVLKVEIPALKQTGDAEIVYTFSSGSFSTRPVTLDGSAAETTLAQIFGNNREISSVLLRQNNTALAEWKGTLTLTEGETQILTLTALAEGRVVGTTIFLDCDAYTGAGLKITYVDPTENTVLGEGTAVLREGEQVGIKVQTNQEGTSLFAQFDFLSTLSKPIIVTVPKTGNLTISFDSKPGFMKIMGRVMDQNDATLPVASAKIALTQTTPGGSSYSQIAYADENGYYAIYGINVGNRNQITVSRAGYGVIDEEVTLDEAKVKQVRDYRLTKLATRILMTFKPEPVADEKGVYAAASFEVLNHLNLTLYDGLNQVAKSDTIKRDNLDGSITYEVVPTDLKSIKYDAPYTVLITSGNTVEARFEVSLSQTGPTAVEGTITPKGALIYRAISAADVPLIGYAAAFDTRTGDRASASRRPLEPNQKIGSCTFHRVLTRWCF